MLRTTLAASAAALLSTLPVVSASGQAVVQNYCDFDVYSWSVDVDHWPTEPYVIKANGGIYRETYRIPGTGGVSIKMAPKNDLSMPITQLEYTIDGYTWYDVSNVDCTGTDCPFQPYGLYLHSNDGCPTVSCTPGNLTCHGAYTLWDDNWASLCCEDPDPDVYLYLCADSPDPPSYHEPQAPAPQPQPTSSSYPDVADAAVQPKKHKQPKPTPVEPATEVVEVTQVQTVMVTVTPYPHHNRERHVHNHAHAHAHAH